jgi:hypothetical protein
MSFTYDVTTSRGKVRLLITDTDSSDYVFEDAEIDAFLSMKSSDIYESGALACETWARSQAKLYKMDQEGDRTIQRYTPTELLKLAQAIRIAAQSGSIDIGAIDVSVPNNLLDSFRPIWTDLTAVPPVE